MADDETIATETDIFKQQEKTINLLYDVLKDKLQQQPQTIYAQAAAEPGDTKATPNYLMYILVGGGLFILYNSARRK